MKVHEIFTSINGEVTSHYQGSLTTFIRLHGCNLACSYCDTPLSRMDSEAKEMTTREIAKQITTPNVTITGGEPLLQRSTMLALIHELKEVGVRKVTIETNGTQPPLTSWSSAVNVCHVMDYKLPSSGQEQYMILTNFTKLYKNDFVKFVMGGEEDLYKALDVMEKLKEKGCLAKFAFSPLGTMDINLLIGSMKTSIMREGILNIQLHKILGLR